MHHPHPIRLVSNGSIRKRLDVPALRLNDLSDVAAHTGGASGFPYLDRWRIEPLHDAVEILVPARHNPHFLDYPDGLERLPNVNRLLFNHERTRPLKLFRFDRVFLICDGSRFAIYREGELSTHSTAVPKAPPPRLLKARHSLPLAAFCDDQFLPSNPSHFVADRLTRQWMFANRAGVAEADCFFCEEGGDYARYARAVACPLASGLKPNEVYFVETLLLLSSTNDANGHPFWYMTEECFGAVRDRLGAVLDRRETRRKVYVARFDARKRPLDNEAAVAAALQEHGFDVVVMSTFSPRDQLGIVANADVVVSPHGAALINIVAARRGTRVVEMFNPDEGTSAYGAVAVLAGANYTAIAGEPIEDPERPRAWRIDPAAVLSAI